MIQGMTSDMKKLPTEEQMEALYKQFGGQYWDELVPEYIFDLHTKKTFLTMKYKCFDVFTACFDMSLPHFLLEFITVSLGIDNFDITNNAAEAVRLIDSRVKRCKQFERG